MKHWILTAAIAAALLGAGASAASAHGCGYGNGYCQGYEDGCPYGYEHRRADCPYYDHDSGDYTDGYGPRHHRGWHC